MEIYQKKNYRKYRVKWKYPTIYFDATLDTASGLISAHYFLFYSTVWANMIVERVSGSTCFVTIIQKRQTQTWSIRQERNSFLVVTHFFYLLINLIAECTTVSILLEYEKRDEKWQILQIFLQVFLEAYDIFRIFWCATPLTWYSVYKIFHLIFLFAIQIYYCS